MEDICRIELLGGIKVTIGDRVVDRFRTRKSASLLVWIAVNSGKRLAREQLAELLWPDIDAETGRNRLKQELSSLRRDLGGDSPEIAGLLFADRNTVGLNESLISVDVREFEAQVTSAMRSDDTRERAWLLVQALDLYRGEFVPTCLDDWASAERNRLAELHATSCQQAASALLLSCDLADAAHYAQRSIRADELNEEAHCLLMRIYIDQGNPTGALRQYRDLERILDGELGTSPSEAAMELAAR